MSESTSYQFETFRALSDEFDSQFSEFLNNKYSSGWKYKDCQFESYGDKRCAYCLFKKKG